MYKGKSILAIIPARSGSKGLKDKNIKLLNGKHLIGYTIEAAIKSSVFEDVVVSTDSSEYAEIAKQYGAKVPFVRPAYLGQDHTSTIDVVLHAVDYLEKEKTYDYVMILQPTSPLRDERDIRESVDKMIMLNADSIISMCECEHPIEWCTSFDDDQMCLAGLGEKLTGRRQEKKKSYRLNGAIYLLEVNFFKTSKSMYGKKSYAYIMTKEHSIDIDDQFDFKVTEMLMMEGIE